MKRYWLVVHADGSVERVEQVVDSIKILDQIYSMIGDSDPVFDVTRMGQIKDFPYWKSDNEIIGIVHDGGLLIPERFPMNRRFSHLAGNVIMGTEAMESADGKDLRGFLESDVQGVYRHVLSLPIVSIEEAEGMRAVMLGSTQ